MRSRYVRYVLLYVVNYPCKREALQADGVTVRL